MKKYAIYSLCLFGLFASRAAAQDTKLTAVTGTYLELKNALVAGDAATAAAKAGVLQTQAAAVAGLTAADSKVYESFKAKLTADAQQIAATKELDKQRVAFAVLSADMLTLSKSVKLSAQALYEQYCPMKKASWISAESDVKNPYYGKMMLTCGKTVQTLQ
jgi:hypothetical protein